MKLEPGERAIKVRRSRSSGWQCPLCEGWVHVGQSICFTSALRWCHTGCVAYAIKERNAS